VRPALLLCLCLLSGAARATVVDLEFGGTVTSIGDYGSGLPVEPAIGDPFSGHVRYDSLVVASPDPDTGEPVFTAAIQSAALSFPGLEFESSGDTSLFDDRGDAGCGASCDLWTFAFRGNADLNAVSHERFFFFIEFRDPTGASLHGTEFFVPPSLDGWSITKIEVTRIETYTGTGVPQVSAFGGDLELSIDSWSATVPEPGALAWLGALAALAARVRSRERVTHG